MGDGRTCLRGALSLNATPELREHSGSASNQSGRSHWPILRPAAGFDLFSGAADQVAEGPTGRGSLRPSIRVNLICPPSPSELGRLIYARLERNGFRPIDVYLFTTLLDRDEFPARDIVTLFGERWNVELDLRHVKTTLEESVGGMD